MEQHSITITEPSIVEYYSANPHLDIVSMNLVFIDILKNLSSNLSTTINSTINSKILSVVSDIDAKISTFKSEIIGNFNDRLAQTKKEYLEDLKLQLTNNLLSNNEKLSSVIDKTTDTIVTKTTSIINDIIPKSQDRNYSQIENCIKTCCSLIEHDTKQLLETKQRDENINSIIIEKIETNFSNMVSSIQTPIFNLIQTSEERTSGGIQKVQNEFIQQQVIQEKLSTELNEFLNKYRNNSSLKGAVSENELYFMLQSIMPSDEILNVSSETASCDFRVNRKNHDKPTILFENKDYNRTVSTSEVNKFERDLQTQGLHGIFLSQKTPITFKDNFQIDIINGIIHIYIPNAHYDIEKLKIAIDIIDNLSPKISQIHTKMDRDIYSTTKQDMEELIQEYHNFAIQKSSILETVKTMSKQLLDKLEAMQLPKIKEILLRFGGLENNSNFKCPHCSFVGKNKASLSAHHNRTNGKCKNTPEENVELENTIIENPVVKSKTSSRKSKYN
jgi:hypothetical protein